jgi:hypothetical protein
MDTETLRDWSRSGEGDCYRRAVDVAEDLLRQLPAVFDIRIAHGLVIGTGGEAEGLRYGHAWVEVGGAIVFDASQGETVSVPLPLYYRAGSVDPTLVVRYSLTEARRAMLDHGHYGPWHIVEEEVA